jgi:hypothetical protein
MSRRTTLTVIALVLIGISAPGAQQRPLPDQESFLRETRKHLQTDSTLQRSYVFVETRRERKLDKSGHATEESVKVVESYPGLPGEERWERLISEDGHPVAADKLAKEDSERLKQANEMAKRLTDDPVKERARQERELQKNRRERDQAVTDVFNVFDMKMVGREPIDGHDTIAFSLTPKRDAKPKTREGDQMRHFLVHAWISEDDHELVRLDAEAIDNLSFGFGVVARLNKGAQLSFIRRKVNGEVWLPAVVNYSGSARVGMLVTLRRSGTSEFSGYRKYTVDTSSTIAAPADERTKE